MPYKGADLLKLLFYRRSQDNILPFPPRIDFSGEGVEF
jgi:hypothetical protein